MANPIDVVVALLLGVASGPPLEWETGPLAPSFEAARDRNRIVCVLVGADWSTWCKKLDDETLTARGVQQELERFQLHRLDFETEPGKEFSRAHNVPAFPSFYFFAKDGKLEEMAVGFLVADDLIVIANRVRRGVDTVSDFERRVLADPDDLDLRYTLALKLDAMEDADGYNRHMEELRRLDPDERSRPLRRMKLRSIQERFYGCQQRGETVDPRELLNFLAEETDRDLLFDGWEYIGTVYDLLGHPAKGREAYRRCWEFVPDDLRMVTVGTNIVMAFWKDRDRLTAADRKFLSPLVRQVRAKGEALALPPADQTPITVASACVLFIDGKRSKAMRMIQIAAEANPADSTVAQVRAIIDG